MIRIKHDYILKDETVVRENLGRLGIEYDSLL
jgi:hypothetical protein